MLDLIDLTKQLSKDEYHARLPRLRLRLLQLQQASWQAGVASIIVFEGWDSAGKGDCVRKMTERLEPRGYRLHYMTREPRTYERYLPWMWRFWFEIPNYGQMTIFHHSWYRRVLLGRGEGTLNDLGWARGIRDILDFERALTDDGYILIKHFLHISKEERERRYKKMEQDPAESWRISKRHWRHHRRYEEYLRLVEEILARTETAAGPWKIVEATDRRWARITVFETVVRRLEDAMKARDIALPDPLDPDEEEDDDGDGGSGDRDRAEEGTA
jgi:polyphosphate kinase 2 (PPK2 family)